MMRAPAIALFTAISGCILEAPPPETDPVAGGGRWRSFARAPVPFHESTAAVSDGKLYYVGGRLPSGRIPSLYRYDPPPQDRWTELAPFPGEPADHMGAVVVDGTLFAFGGMLSWPGPSVSSAYAYDPSNDRWTTRSPLPKPVGAMGVGVVDGKVYCIGGLSGSQATNFVFEYDPVTDLWSDWTSTCPLPTARDHCVAATVNGKIHMIGGRRVEIDSLMDVHEVFDPLTRIWNVASPLPTPRAGFAAAVLNDTILIMGGEGATTFSGVFSDNEQYDPRTDTWRSLSPLKTPRHSIQAGVIDGVVYVAAGSPGVGRTFTDVHEGFSFAFTE